MPFDYASRDYDTIKTELLARAARVAPEWTDRDPSDFGMVLVDLWANTADVLHYYIDRAASETLLSTAQQRESVLALANLFDYIPRSRGNASGTVTLRNASSSDVEIPAYTRFVARANNAVYHLYTPADVTLLANSITAVNLREGTIVNTEKVTGLSGSSGKSNQRYTLSNRNVIKSSVRVFVYEDGSTPVQYRTVERIADSIPGERVHLVETNADGETVVVFGSTAYGFVPPQGSSIEVRYAYGKGSEGNIPANSVTGFYASTPDGVTVASSSAFSGGTDDESIVSMRNSLPSAISSQNRAVTESDYKNLALQVQGVAKAALSYSSGTVTLYVHGEESNFLAVTATSSTENTDLESRVQSYVGERSVVGVSVVAESVINYAQIYLKPKIYVNDRFVASWVKQDVANVIDSLFSFDRIGFGQTLTLGRIYSAILSVAGVDYVTVDPTDGGGYFSNSSSVLTTPATVQAITVPYNELPKLHLDTGETSILSKIVVSGGIQGT